MQSLDVISINIWQILVSLANLALLFFVAKKFLYKPVKKMMATRQDSIDSQYAAAKEAEEKAMQSKSDYEEKLSGAKKEADNVIQSAVDTASLREKEILAEAKEKAENIIQKAKEDAELEKKKAQESIKKEIVEVGTLLAEKMLEREISAEDHKDIIDSFIDSIGDENEGN